MSGGRRLKRQIERQAGASNARGINVPRLVLVVLIALVLVVGTPLLVGWLLSHQQHPANVQAPSPAPSSSSAAPAASPTVATEGAAVPTGPASGGSDAGELEHDAWPTASAPATQPPWSAGESKKAKETATKAAEAFTNTTLSAKDWLAGLAPFLQADARKDYASTDPKNVPFFSVESVGDPTPDAQYSQFVEVPVKAEGGTFTVELIYSNDYRRFEVTQFRFGDER